MCDAVLVGELVDGLDLGLLCAGPVHADLARVIVPAGGDATSVAVAAVPQLDGAAGADYCHGRVGLLARAALRRVAGRAVALPGLCGDVP